MRRSTHELNGPSSATRVAALASSLYRKRATTLDPAVSMKTTLTWIRILELQNDPFAPQD